MYRKIIEDLKIWKESPSQKFEVFPRKIRHTAFYKVFVGKLGLTNIPLFGALNLTKYLSTTN